MSDIHADSVVDQNRRAYGRIAREWERRQAADYDHEFHARCRTEFHKYLKGDRVLDIGCGLGLDSQEFARAGLRVVAADIATEFLSIITGRQPAVPAVAVDMTKPCFRDGAFDGVYAVASLLHVPPQLVGQGLRECLLPRGSCSSTTYRLLTGAAAIGSTIS